MKSCFLNGLLGQTPRQKKIESSAFIIAVVVDVLLAAGFVSSIVSEHRQPGEIGLESQINPNDAPVASLVRLPGIGSGRAEAIVAYRKDFAEQNKNRSAFQNPNDLQKVKGIGHKTVENIKGWLKFK